MLILSGSVCFLCPCLMDTCSDIFIGANVVLSTPLAGQDAAANSNFDVIVS